MKNRLLVSVFGFLVHAFGLAQGYVPVLDSLNEWHFTNCYFGCVTDLYYTNGDTVVDGKNCKILDGYHYSSRTFLLYENTADKQITLYKIEPDKIKAFLLYDFSKNEGDSMELLNPVSPFPTNLGYFTLDSIRMKILQDGNAYRHFYWSPTSTNSLTTNKPIWIEGVGSLSLINAAGGNPDINGVGQLSCYFKNSELIYADLDSISSCQPTHLLTVQEQQLGEVEVYPNPFTTHITVSSKFFGQSYLILNPAGKIMRQGRLEGDLSIDLHFLREGVYFIAFDSKKQFKLIKI